MEENKTKKKFRTGLFIFIILLMLCILKAVGLFNFLYIQRLKRISNNNIAVFNNFINNKVKITATISGDTIIQSSLIQYNYKRQLIVAYKHLTLYKQNFPEIRNISLFNPQYEIVLASEIDEYIINKNLNKKWFLNSSTKGYYISEISYVNKYNEFLISIIYPIKNIINENIGFLMVDFSLAALFNKFDEFKNTVVILKKQDKFIFTYPLAGIIKSEKDMNRFPHNAIIEKRYDQEHRLIVAAEKEFFALPVYLKIILILIFAILIVFFIYYWFDKYIGAEEKRREKFKKMTDEIISFSKKITMQNIDLKEGKEGIKDKLKEDADEESIRKREELKRSEKSRSKMDKYKNDGGDGFVLIE